MTTPVRRPNERTLPLPNNAKQLERRVDAKTCVTRIKDNMFGAKYSCFSNLIKIEAQADGSYKTLGEYLLEIDYAKVSEGDDDENSAVDHVKAEFRKYLTENRHGDYTGLLDEKSLRMRENGNIVIVDIYNDPAKMGNHVEKNFALLCKAIDAFKYEQQGFKLADGCYRLFSDFQLTRMEDFNIPVQPPSKLFPIPIDLLQQMFVAIQVIYIMYEYLNDKNKGHSIISCNFKNCYYQKHKLVFARAFAETNMMSGEGRLDVAQFFDDLDETSAMFIPDFYWECTLLYDIDNFGDNFEHVQPENVTVRSQLSRYYDSETIDFKQMVRNIVGDIVEKRDFNKRIKLEEITAEHTFVDDE